jgi:hypothetical protein
MQLAALHAAIGARLFLGIPIVLFVTEAQPIEEHATKLKLKDSLGRSDSLGPACGHTPSAKFHELLLSHEPLEREGRHLTGSRLFVGDLSIFRGLI